MKRSSLMAIALAFCMTAEMPASAYAAQVPEDTETQTVQAQTDGTENDEAEETAETVTGETGEGGASGQKSGDEAAEDGEASDTDAQGEDEAAEETGGDGAASEESTETGAADTAAEDEAAEDVTDITDTESEEVTELLAGTGVTELAEEDYELSGDQIEEKKEAAGMLEGLRKADEGEDYEPDTVFFFADSKSEAADIAEAYNSDLTDYAEGVGVVSLDAAVDVEKAVEIGACEDINLPAVYPNYYRYACDTDDGVQGAFLDSSLELTSKDTYGVAYGYQWFQSAIGSEYAWEAGYTGAGIKVAVIDSGVSNTHVNVTADYTTMIQRTDEDGNPDTSDTTDLDSTDDVYNHGTHVSGIISSVIDIDNDGTYEYSGIAPETDIINIRALHDDGKGADAELVQALKKAIELEPDIINMSIGGYAYSTAYSNVLNEAYEAGIMVVAAAGNEGGDAESCPAALDHVVSVAATDQDNKTASFSNFGSTVDLAAPGCNIYSTFSTVSSAASESGYGYEDGTSMATPVVSGEAALILQAANEGRISAITAAEGTPERVDQLEAYMKKCTVSAGSGMGAGIVYLPKALNLTVSDSKPAAPSVKGTVASDGQSVDISLSSGAGTNIYFTLNGSTPDYTGDSVTDYDASTVCRADGTVYRVSGNTADITVTAANADDEALTSAKITVNALAVNSAGTAGPAKKASYTLRPYVTEILVSGANNRVEIGKSIQLYAEVSPAIAANKKVNWYVTAKQPGEDEEEDVLPALSDLSLFDETDMISISSSGKLSVSKDAAYLEGDDRLAQYYYVVAAAKDGSGIYGYYQVEIASIDNKIASVKLGKSSIKVELTGTDSETIDLGDDDICGFSALYKDGNAATPFDFQWTSSDPSVAFLTLWDDDGHVKLEVKKPGTAKITALANDGTGKKATVTVKAVRNASGVTISDVNSTNTVSAGTSVQMKAAVSPEDTTNRNIKWQVSVDDPESEAKSKGVTISSSGKLSVGKNAEDGLEVTVRASAVDSLQEDGTYAVYAEKTITVNTGVITGITLNTGSIKLFRVSGYSGSAPTTDSDTDTDVIAAVSGKEGFDCSQITAVSSNPKLVTASCETVEGDDSVMDIVVKATGKGTGSATVTVSATDGSGKKAKLNVKVVNPASAVNISLPRENGLIYVPVGKTTQFKAAVMTKYGAVSTKNLKWSIYKAFYISDAGDGQHVKYEQVEEGEDYHASITASGKMTLDSAAFVNTMDRYAYIVKAEVNDGSGVCGVYTVYANSISDTGISLYSGEKVCSTRNTIQMSCLTDNQRRSGYAYPYIIEFDDTNGYNNLTAYSSNTAVAEVYTTTVTVQNPEYPEDPTKTINKTAIRVIPKKKGTFRITLVNNNGYGSKATYNCRVTAPSKPF